MTSTSRTAKDRRPEPAAERPAAKPVAKPSAKPAKEIGGRDGPDPTRYGDWEKAGRAVDF